MSDNGSNGKTTGIRGSRIMGGGRAPLSDIAEEGLVSLLMTLRHPEKVRSKSAAKRIQEQKQFTKKLVERYERERASKKINNSASDVNGADSSGKGAKVDDDVGSTSKPSATTPQAVSKKEPGPINTNTTATGGKVRVELAEAIFSESKKGSGKSKSNKNKGKDKGKDKDGISFKEGNKKVIVFTRSTTIPELLKQAQSKLRMKKKPGRAFILEKGSSTIEVDLRTDLAAIEDGTTIYISQDESSKKPVADKGRDEKTETSTSTEDQNGPEDPLELVKKAYFSSRRKNTENHNRRRQRPEAEHPNFTGHFENLSTLPEARAVLPAASCRERILQSVQENRVTIICGATGCGKSTQIPQFLLEGMKACGKEENTNIIVTQPRRVAAISLARRVADEMDNGEPGSKGSEVGYSVRLDRAVSDSTRILYCTVGILLRMLVSPSDSHETANTGLEDTVPEEDGPARSKTKPVPLAFVSHVVIDEVHERDTNTDFVLTLLRALLRINPHLRIILMSATASAQLFVSYFSTHLGKEPEVISIPGRSFPVDIKWLDECERYAGIKLRNFKEHIEKSEYDRFTESKSNANLRLSPRAVDKIDNNFIRDLLVAIISKERSKEANAMETRTKEVYRKNGAILVFLPGKAEIDSLAKTLYDDQTLGKAESCCKILKLHSSIPRSEQQIVFKAAKVGTSKIVLATNIAETSITIPDVSHVVDTGRVKESRYNSSSRIKELVTVWTSRASAKQRAGRAGRTSAGMCWRLFSENFSNTYLPSQTPPEILRTPLDELVLQVCLLFEQRRDELAKVSSKTDLPIGTSPIKMLRQTPEPPPIGSLEEATEHLLEVDALHLVDTEPISLYRLTPLGYHLSRLPMDTKVGKVLIVGCILGCLDGALTVAAALSCTKSCFQHRWGAAVDAAYESAVEKRLLLIKSGFGGEGWKGGTVKGDLMATLATYNKWSRCKSRKERSDFCRKHALEQVVLWDMHDLRNQFLDCLKDAGFVSRSNDACNRAQDDALLTSCCLVAGLYPNVCTLQRPGKGRPKGGRLITKEGEVCRPNSSSFQRDRLSKAASTGKDAYAVYHEKQRSLGTGGKIGEVFLSEVNFISRFALILFGGELDIVGNSIVLDGWLRFKIGDKGLTGAVLLLTLREELDKIMLNRITNQGGGAGEDQNNDEVELKVVDFVRKLLATE